ncbi:MAG: hypothetical protein RLZ98_228 [Pseudomonadota bacterium]
MTVELWQLPETEKNASNLGLFSARIAEQLAINFNDYDDLHRWSVENSGAFWAHMWTEFSVLGDPGPPPYLVDRDLMPGAQFFPAARLNYAENLLSNTNVGDAIVFRGEQGRYSRLSWDELRQRVARLASHLRAIGITPGDRVAAVLPNVPEAVVAVLACAAVGAIWSSCSPDFGTRGIVDRFGQIEPRVLLCADGYSYGGKSFDLTDRIVESLQALESVTHVVVVDSAGRADRLAKRIAALQGRTGPLAVAEFSAVAVHGPSVAPEFNRLPFAHPLYILFSSGTTGVPKCIVHSAGGLLLKHLSEQRLHTDIKPGDRLFYFTTLSWMMWNWLVSGLASGATLLLYDGNPFHPDGNVLWDFAAEERCTHFGTSAKYIDAMKKSDLAPARRHDLSSLRCIMSTGSPLAPESFDYVYADIKSDVHLASISGGTDICGCFVIGNPLLPVRRGEIQCAALGMDIDVVDEHGNSITGEKGELVCRNAFPSMPVGFWNDPDGARYRATYFDRFPGIWHHGDFAERTLSGGFIIHGRSDATLNPGGVRIGTAEIYRQVEQLQEIRESIAIGQEWQGDVRIVLFVVLQPGATLDDALAARIRTGIREGASPRHVPARIVAVPDIPRTKSGKITELAVRDVVHGRSVSNKEALANPEALAHFIDVDELRH